MAESMFAPDYTIRPAAVEDLPALEAALAWAIEWRLPELSATPGEVIERSGHAYLLAEWGRSGDAAVIARAGSGSVGAAWCRFWTEERHSYGHVAPDVPELGVGLDPLYRGRGVGRALVSSLIQMAVRVGVQRVSLSVEWENAPACQLYERLGFARVGVLGNAWTMVRVLDESD